MTMEEQEQQSGGRNYDKGFVGGIVLAMKFDVAVWFVIALGQILLGLILVIFGYGVVMILCGGWNIYNGIVRWKSASYLKKHPASIYSYFNGMSDTSYLIVFLCNLVFGGFIGVIGVIYDFILKQVVIKNRSRLPQ